MLRIGRNKWVTAGWGWLAIAESYPTDEGFYSCETRYQLERGRLVCHQNVRARDCDGRTDNHWEGQAKGLRLRIWRNNSQRPISWRNRPHLVIGLRWKKIGSSQRDYTAEGMGY